MIALDIIRFCARECELQMSGERSVAWMVKAWEYAQSQAEVDTGKPLLESRLPTVDDVLQLGTLVEPFKNSEGFRRVGVRVGWDVKPEWQDVPRQMVNLMEGQDVLTPNEFFKAYEEVHPFRDGNGRTGVILFNWLNDTLDSPVWPKNFWNDPRRLPGDGAEEDYEDSSPFETRPPQTPEEWAEWGSWDDRDGEVS